MQEIHNIYNSINTKYNNDSIAIEKLLSFLAGKLYINNPKDEFLHKSLCKHEPIDLIKIIQLIGLMHQKRKQKNIIAKTDERKHHGIYYTDYAIAKYIAKTTLSFISSKKELSKLNFLEPCSGIGIFVFAYIDCIFERINKISKNQAQNIINNIFCSDIDPEAINILKNILPIYINRKYGFKITLNDNNFFIGNLLFNIRRNKISKNDPKTIFDVRNGFDIILTNPPYRLLKANSNKYAQGKTNYHESQIKRIIEFIRKNKIYRYNEGTLNYYKIFVEEIVENYSHNSSKLGLLISNTLLNDKQSEKLRKKIFQSYYVSRISIIPEKNNFFPDITQAFCFFSIDKKRRGNTIKINPAVRNKYDLNKPSINIDFKKLKRISESLPIIALDNKGFRILFNINKHPKLNTFASLSNLRGELDLTIDKSFISLKETPYPLLRGNNIKEFSYEYSKYFAKEKFLLNLNGKQDYINQERLVCQQVSNIHANKRIKFAKIPANIILANSCNFISINKEVILKSHISLDYLLGILNSFLLDWQFKARSSNNHISNYEISEFPIAISNNRTRKQIESLADKIQQKNKVIDIIKLNIEVFKLYNLTKEESLHILNQYAGELVDNIKNRLNNAL